MSLACPSTVLLAGLTLSAAAQPQSIALEPLKDHSDTAETFTGTSGATREAVNVYVDSRDALMPRSSGTGAIRGALTIPVTAQPSNYTIAAIRRRSRVVSTASCMVYVAADHSKLYAITSSGGLAWTYTSGVALNGSPAVADGIVYVAATDHKLYAINATDGSLVWSALTGDAAGRSAPPASLNAPSEKTLVSVPSDR